MANKDQTRGFRPHGKVRSANPYVTSAIVYPGDLVVLGSDGKIAVAAAGTVPSLGVALTYAASGASCLVADAPDQLFTCQTDDNTVAAQTNLGLNYDITVGTASTLYKRSACEIDASTGTTDSNKAIRVLRLAPEIDNAFGDQADVICKINNHRLGNAVEGL